jgi:hypothetical protein
MPVLLIAQRCEAVFQYGFHRRSVFDMAFTDSGEDVVSCDGGLQVILVSSLVITLISIHVLFLFPTFEDAPVKRFISHQTLAMEH